MSFIQQNLAEIIFATIGLCIIFGVIKIEKNINVPKIWSTILGIIALVPLLYKIYFDLFGIAYEGTSYGFAVWEYFLLFLLCALLVAWWYSGKSFFQSTALWLVLRILLAFSIGLLMMYFGFSVVIFWLTLILVYFLLGLFPIFKRFK